MAAEPAKQRAERNEGQPEKGENPATSDSRAFEDPEGGVGKVEAPAGRFCKTNPTSPSGSQSVRLQASVFSAGTLVLPTQWHFNGAGMGFPPKSCKAQSTVEDMAPVPTTYKLRFRNLAWTITGSCNVISRTERPALE